MTDDGAVFLVMELLDGETVEARKDRAGGTLPVLESLSVAEQVLDVLAAAHDKGIIHRDIKPENLFITRDGTLKLLDFGIAHLRELPRTTRSKASMGTPAFMSPEQASGRWELVDARADVWAVGASLFYLTSGKIVHDAPTVNLLLVKAMTAPAPSLRSVAPDAPEAMVRLVDRALAFDPAQRFDSARSMQDAVRAAYHAIARAPVQSAPRLAVPAVDPHGETQPVRLDPPRGRALPRAQVTVDDEHEVDEEETRLMVPGALAPAQARPPGQPGSTMVARPTAPGVIMGARPPYPQAPRFSLAARIFACGLAVAVVLGVGAAVSWPRAGRGDCSPAASASVAPVSDASTPLASSTTVVAPAVGSASSQPPVMTGDPPVTPGPVRSAKPSVAGSKLRSVGDPRAIYD